MKNNIINARHTGVELVSNSRLYGVFQNTIRATRFPLHARDAGLGLEIVNDILINRTAEPTLYVPEGADVDVTDYNVLSNDDGDVRSTVAPDKGADETVTVLAAP